MNEIVSTFNLKEVDWRLLSSVSSNLATSAVRSVLTTWVQYGINIVNKIIMIYVQSGLQIGKQSLFQLGLGSLVIYH